MSHHAAQPEDPNPSSRWAIRHVPSHLRLWIAAIGGLVLDLWSKDWAFHSLQPDRPRTIIPNLCSFHLSLNPGALFGIGAGLAPIFVGASVLALLFVLYLFANSTRCRWSLHIALGLVLAGAVGNLYDRTTQTAYVVHMGSRGKEIGTLVAETADTVTLVDFDTTNRNRRTLPRPTDPQSGPQPVVRDFIKIELKIGAFTLWPWIFNVADALLVVGVGLLLLNFWFEHRDGGRGTGAKESAAHGTVPITSSVAKSVE